MEASDLERGEGTKASFDQGLTVTGPFNVLLIGEFGAGKTSLAERVVYGRSPKDATPAPTHGHHWTGVGVDLVDGPHVAIHLWDTAGEEQFNGGRFMNSNYFRRAHALIMAYDIAGPDAERQIQTWFSLWRGYMSATAPVIVVGTKQDLPPNQHKMLHFVVSSVTGNGVPEMLGELGRLLFETYGLTSNPPSAALPSGCRRTGCCSLMVAPDDEHVDWLIRTADNVKQAPRRDNNYLGAATSMTPKPKPGSQLSVSGVTSVLSVDLLAASRAYLDFLTKVEQTLTTQLLTNRHRVAQAIDRYAKFLRLKSLFPSEAVWALPDIEFVWKSHLIRPLDYKKEMKATFGNDHDHDHYEVPPSAEDVLGRTAALWSQLYDGEAYVPDWLTPDLLAPFLTGASNAQCAEERNSEPLPSTEGIEAPSWEEVRAGIRVVNEELVMEDARWLPNLRRFLDVEKMEEVVQEKQLQACLDGYARFLTRKKLKGDNSDGGDGDEDDGEATYDVDLMWHAHMLHPQAYWRDCAQMGLALDHRPWPHLFPSKSA